MHAPRAQEDVQTFIVDVASSTAQRRARLNDATDDDVARFTDEGAGEGAGADPSSPAAEQVRRVAKGGGGGWHKAQGTRVAKAGGGGGGDFLSVYFFRCLWSCRPLTSHISFCALC